MAKAKKKETLSLEEKLEQALVPVDEQPYEVPENWCWVTVGNIASSIVNLSCFALAILHLCTFQRLKLLNNTHK